MALDKLGGNSFSTGAIANSLGYTPANKAGDTFTGAVAVSNTLSVGNTTITGTANVSGQVLAKTFTAAYPDALSSFTQDASNGNNVLLVGPQGDRDCWIYRDPAGGATNWGIYHRQIDSTLASLPGNSIGFIGGNALAGYVDLQNKVIRGMNGFDMPYMMVVRVGGYLVPDGYSNIVYDVLVHSRSMSHNSGTNMIFDVPGKYLITTGWRFGSGGDVWSGVRLRDNDGTIRGKGFATGQVTNDPGPCHISFIADIPAARVGQAMSMQFIRAGSTMNVASPASTDYGYGIVTTVTYVGVN